MDDLESLGPLGDPRNTYKILHFNAGSLCNKLEYFSYFLDRYFLLWDILCITETWFPDGFVPQFPNFKVISKSRLTKSGGELLFISKII